MSAPPSCHHTNVPRFVIYRDQMLRLLAYPKPVWEQLRFELPCLMGFRTSEVATWKAEYIDFRNGNTYVLDAKKHKLFLIPLSIQVAVHAEEALNGKAEGYVVENRSRASKGPDKPLTDGGIWWTWKKYTKKLGLHDDIMPLTGRQWFAAEWFYQQKLSLVTLSQIMRHNHIETTLGYVAHLVFYEDLKKDFEQFELGVYADRFSSEVNTEKFAELVRRNHSVLENLAKVKITA